MGLRLLFIAACLACTSCASPAATAATCASATIGAAGGVVVAPSGTTLVVPSGALAADTSVEVCALSALTRQRDQQSETIVVRPTGTTLAVPATFTMATFAARIGDAHVEVGQTLDDAAPETIADVRIASSSVSFDHTRFGYVRVFGTVVEDMRDAGPADTLDRDVFRSDAGPTPLAPVVTGVDLDPADYSCLGADFPVQSGDPVTAQLRVVDWHDRSFRAGYLFRVMSGVPSPDTKTTCEGLANCELVVSDAAGNVSVTLPSGPAWIDVIGLDGSVMATDDRHVPGRQLHLPIVLSADSGVIEVEAASQRTLTSSGVFTTHFGQITMGRVRDCNGDVVQRARLRVFGNVRELRNGETMSLNYGSTGLPTMTRERTGADGTFLVDNLTGEPVRIEAWGQLVPGGPEVMLSCVDRRVATSVIVIGDLLPARSDRHPACTE